MGHEHRFANGAEHREAVNTIARLASELNSTLIEHDATLLQLVRDAYRLAGVNVKVELK